MFSSTTSAASPFDVHWSHYPRSYIATKVPKNIALIDYIDGDLTKDVWSKVPWSEYFDDIRGSHDAPPADRPRPTCSTRFKMMWDDDYLYVGALLTSDFTTVATFHERNEPIFQQDSDFEVFLDPLGSCHYYKEFEVNAINTVWNLMLDRPYDDDGKEHSGRVAKPGDPMFYEVYHQKTATQLVQGKLNDPNGGGATWSVEMAFGHRDTLSHHYNSDKYPKESTFWRINFSRVEKRGDTNWTWQPQIVWDAAKKRYAGFVKMHLPDAWGYLVFGNEHGQLLQPNSRDPTWPARFAAMNVYYAQHEYRRINGSFAKTVDNLTKWLDEEVIRPFVVKIKSGSNDKGVDFFVASIAGNPDGSIVSVSNCRQVIVTSYLSDNSSTV